MNRRRFLTTLVAAPVAAAVALRAKPLPTVTFWVYRPSARQLHFFDESALRKQIAYTRGCQWLHYDKATDSWRDPAR